MNSRRTLLTLALAAGMALAVPAAAETTFEGTLSGAAAGTDSPATGTVEATLDDAQTELSYTISYAGLVGTETVAHFHNAPPGENGPPVHLLPPENPKVGTWAISPDMVAELLAGNIYVNIHTDAHPSGEIAGWLEESSVPADATTLSQVRHLFR